MDAETDVKPNLISTANISCPEFDQTVKRSKAGAEEALKKIPLIERNINEAVSKTSEARSNLAGAEADAIAAKEIAEQALVLAERALKVCLLVVVLRFVCHILM